MPASGLSMEYQVSIIRRIEGGKGGGLCDPLKKIRVTPLDQNPIPRSDLILVQ